MPEVRPKVLIEDGIGETRAIIVAQGTIVEAHVERPGGWRWGDVRAVRLAKILVPGVRAIVVADGVEALLTPLPPTLTEGAALRVRVVREALAEAGRPRLAKVVATADAVAAGPTLAERLAARGLPPVRADAGCFEACGWTETIEAAIAGRVAFARGSLTISPTPAMTVIDVDGDLAPVALALAAADAAAGAIRCFDLVGSIGIDFPTVADRSARMAVGARLDAALPPPFERTAVNGFGFVQIVRPRQRASLVEALTADRAATASLRLLRTAESGCGRARLVVPPPVGAWLEARPDLLDELARRRGGHIDLQVAPALPMSAGHVAPVP